MSNLSLPFFLPIAPMLNGPRSLTPAFQIVVVLRGALVNGVLSSFQPSQYLAF